MVNPEPFRRPAPSPDPSQDAARDVAAGAANAPDSPPRNPKGQRRGIYLLPNLLTTAALFSGFYAIVAAMNNRFEAAAIAIFVAMVFDTLDGRIARMTNTQSAFGAEYDSLSDVISFGLAPALVAYEWSLFGLGKLGWMAAFLYAAATALRLARFNTQLGTADKRYFQGLPSPAAAAVVAGLVWVATDYGLEPTYLASVALVVTVLTGLLMVTNVRFYSGKALDLKGKVPFTAIVGIVVVFMLVQGDPPLVLFLAAFLYACSGPVMTLVEIRRRRAARRHGAAGNRGAQNPGDKHPGAGPS